MDSNYNSDTSATSSPPNVVREAHSESSASLDSPFTPEISSTINEVVEWAIQSNAKDFSNSDGEVDDSQSEHTASLTYKLNFEKWQVSTERLLNQAGQVIAQIQEVKKNELTEGKLIYAKTLLQLKFSIVENNLNYLRGVADDCRIMMTLFPDLNDQAKTISLIVEGLQAHARKLQMEFQVVVNSQQRDDLFRLSRSPFDEQRPRRRVGKAGEISSGATDSLMHSQKVLMETVSRSAGTLEQLAQSSNAIVNNHDELMEQNSVVGTSNVARDAYATRCEKSTKIKYMTKLTMRLMEEAFAVLKHLKKEKLSNDDYEYQQRKMKKLVSDIGNNKMEMKSISNEMNMVQNKKKVALHIKDVAKSISVAVESLEKDFGELLFRHACATATWEYKSRS